MLSARFKAQRLEPARADERRVPPLARDRAARARRAHRHAPIPGARVTWRYQVVLDGLAVVAPAHRARAARAVPGVAEVWPSVTYRPLLDRSPKLIGADQLWGAPLFDTAGNGIKIGIIDDGVDQTHPFFNPSGYTMPPGFPKGQTDVHDREGDRRAGVLAADEHLEVRAHPRSTRATRSTRRTSPGSPPATTRRARSPAAARSRASRRTRISATTRC